MPCLKRIPLHAWAYILIADSPGQKKVHTYAARQKHVMHKQA